MGSPPVLYLTDDEDETSEFSYHVNNEHLPRKKRTLLNSTALGTLPMSHWSKRPRHDTYQPEPIVMDSDDYHDEEPHSFHTFDWTIEQRTPAHVNGYSQQPMPRAANIPSSNIMHLLEHYARQPDNVLPLPMHQPRVRFPVSPPPMPLSLPLPKPTSSLAHVPSQRRSESRKPMSMLYTSSVSLEHKQSHKQRSQPPVYLASRNISISRRHTSSAAARCRHSRRPP